MATPNKLSVFFQRRLFWLRRYGLRLLVAALFIMALLPESIYPIHRQWYAISATISDVHFDYVSWEVNALFAKVNQTLYGQHPFIDKKAGVQFVRDYMQDLSMAQTLEAQINQIYSNPDITDAADESADLRLQRDTLRRSLNERQSTVEAILEGQVAAVLTEQGFGTGGQLLPPIAMRFSRVPNLLVTSPRDSIQMDMSLNLYNMPIDAIVNLEQTLEQQHDLSTLIVPLGGIALYPAMIMETSSIQRSVEVFAHEWLHHYLYFFPLGLDYFFNADGFGGESRIINETTADLFGKEIALRVLDRYYPDLVPPFTPKNPPDPITSNTPEVSVFDAGAAMHETRTQVDAYLANGDIDRAESYMEERRQYMYENGYRLRRLNQAFFAFYGGYQGGAVPGIGGEDPIGPAVRRIRERSANVHDFIVQMRDITTREQLIALAEQPSR